MEPLTDRQREVLEAIMKFYQDEDRPPTTRELAALVGRHQKTVCQYLEVLESKGCIERRKGYIRLADELRQSEEGVPIVGRVAAGSPVLAIENVEGRLSLEDMFRGGGGTFALRVQGDSMIDAHICDGDYVIVRQQPRVEDGEIGVAMIDDEATVKRIHVRGRMIRLIPENASYRPMEFDLAEDNVRIVGKVVGLFRRTDY